MITFQDFQKETDIPKFIAFAINDHIKSDEYKIAQIANKYDRQQNVTIYEYVKTIFTLLGGVVEDYTSSNNKIASNFFHKLNTQRCNYSLGNGVSFSDHNVETISDDGVKVMTDQTKEMLGQKFDTDLKTVAYNALIHRVCFGYWNLDRLYSFPLTEFVPFWDEDTSALRAGIRFWKLANDKPMIAVLYEEDGYTKYKSNSNGLIFEEVEPKRAYKTIVKSTEVDGEQVIGEQNYSSLPIVPLWGNKIHQSTLIGMRPAIDAFDLIKSGFANDIIDCAQIYWIISNAGGMSDSELERFRDRLKLNHIAVADTDNSAVTPYFQDVPYQSRKESLQEIRSGIYEDFGALDVHTIAAGATNDHIDAAYQSMDDEADDFEFQIIEFVQQILSLMGIEDVPVFKRNKISNQKEQTEMVLSAADILDEETILNKLPFISVDEIYSILAKKDKEDFDTFSNSNKGEKDKENEEEIE